MKESIMDRALVPCLFWLALIACIAHKNIDAIVCLLYAIGVLLIDIRNSLRRAGARGESDG